MIKLIVRGEEVELFKKESFAISKAVSKIGQFDLRFGDVSVSFNVPLTSKNNRIFRYISNLNNDNIGAFKRFEGEIREFDSILSTGYFQVLSSNRSKKEIKLRFFGGNSDWFDLIKDRFINVVYQKTEGNSNSTTYDLTYLNHNFEKSVIVDSKDNYNGYFYFPCDNGSNSDRVDNILNINDFQCGVYEHTIFKNIFDSIGIKTKGSMFNDPLFYQTIVTAGKSLQTFSSKNNQKSFKPIEGVLLDKLNFQPIQFPNGDRDNQWNGNTFTAAYDIDDFRLRLKLEGYKDGLLGGQGVDIKIEYTINGVQQTDIIETLPPEYTKTTGNTIYISLFEYENILDFQLLKVGDTIKVYVKENNAGPSNFFLTNSNNFNNVGTVESYLEYDIIGAVSPYDINNAIPKIKQSDFIKDIMFRLGVVSNYDAKKRVVTFDKFQDVENNKPKALDFSKKIDVSKDIEVNFTKVVEKYFKTSFIRYKEDENDTQLRLFKTVAKLGLGDGEIRIDNDNLSDEGDIFSSVYSATKDAFTFPLSGSNFSFYLPYLPFLNTENSEQKIEPRVLIAVPDTKVSSFSDSFTTINLGGAFGATTNVGYAFFAKQNTKKNRIISPDLDTNLSTLSFQNYTESNQSYFGSTLLEKNFDLYIKILNNPIYLPIYLDINNLDVKNYNPLIPIYLDFSLDNGYYYLEEISQYKGDGSTTKCNLVKI